MIVLLKLPWRYRRQLVPAGALTVVVAIAVVGHAALSTLAWVPLAAGLAVAGAFARYGYRPVHAWYSVGALATGLWLAAAWWLGLADPSVLGALAILTVVGPAAWMSHHLPRSRVVIIGGSRWPWQWSAWRFRQRHTHHLQRAVAEWPATGARAKVPGVGARWAVADTASPEYEMVIDLNGYALADLLRGRDRIASGLRARRMTVRIEPDEDYEHLARVIWARDDARQDAWEAEQPVTAADEAPAERPEPEDLADVRLERLRAAVERAGARAVSGRELARRAGVDHNWVARHIEDLALRLGLRRVDGGWRRLAVEESTDGGQRWAG